MSTGHTPTIFCSILPQLPIDVNREFSFFTYFYLLFFRSAHKAQKILDKDASIIYSIIQ